MSDQYFTIYGWQREKKSVLKGVHTVMSFPFLPFPLHHVYGLFTGEIDAWNPITA